MDKVAGQEGEVFLIPDFDELNKQIDAMLAAACGKLALEISFFDLCL